MTNEIGGQIEGQVKWISRSDKNNSFNLQEDEKIWYVLDDTAIEEVLNKGDKISFKFRLEGNQRTVSKEDIQVQERTEQEKNWQEDIISFEDLLDEAHKKFDGLFSISTELIQVDWEKGLALFKARIHDRKSDQEFIGHGDATQENCGDMIKPHFIRMAETRAIARALRFATNNAKVADVETEKAEATE